jgi:hypothetical protein
MAKHSILPDSAKIYRQDIPEAFRRRLTQMLQRENHTITRSERVLFDYFEKLQGSLQEQARYESSPRRFRK